MSEQPDWHEWFERHAPALVLLARQWHARAADADDIVQEAFLKAWRQRDAVQDFAAYVFASVRTTAMDAARGRQRTVQREEAAAMPVGANSWFESNLDADDWRNTVAAALVQLPVEQREVLVLKIWGDLSFAQIAGTLCISNNTAASRYRYALQNLRRLVGEDYAS